MTGVTFPYAECELTTIKAERDRLAAEVDRLAEALQNVMGHINTPISRRRLGIANHWPEWLESGVDALAAHAARREDEA